MRAPRAENKHLDRKLARESIERALLVELALAPSLSQVANELDVAYQLIRYHLPELARAVCLRYRARSRMQQPVKHQEPIASG